MIISLAALRNEAERCGHWWRGEETMAKVKRRRRRMLGQVERGLRTGCAPLHGWRGGQRQG